MTPGSNTSVALAATLTAGLSICASCSATETAAIERIAAIDSAAINEASGLVVSEQHADVFWTHNDSGSKAHLYAVGTDGRVRLRLRLDKTDNRDWEDLAILQQNDKPHLLVGDIGDNEGKRKHVSLYVIAEPPLTDDDKIREKPLRAIDVRYPDGARDAEALAVEGQTAYILTKRDIPPRLYSVDLATTSDELLAHRLAAVTTLPPPTQRDVEFAPKLKDWHWQPTAMDIARDGSGIAIMTYRAVYYYPRRKGETVSAALARRPLKLDLGDIKDAEAMGFAPDGRSLLLTVERKHAPLYRVQLPDNALELQR